MYKLYLTLLLSLSLSHSHSFSYSGYARYSNAKFKLTNWFDSWIINGRQHIWGECILSFYSLFFKKKYFILFFWTNSINKNVQIQKQCDKRVKKTRIIHCKILTWIFIFPFFGFGFAIALHCIALSRLYIYIYIRHKILPVIFTYNILYTLFQKLAQTFTHKRTLT